MSLLFNTGFTHLSYLNLTKMYTEKIYENAINSPSNANIKIKTNGLKFFYETHNNLNASVYIKDNYEYMIINTGTLVTMYSLIHSAFSSPNVFTNIGEVQNEIGSQSNGYFVFQKKQILFDNAPIDETRREVSEYVSLLAIRFIVMHELGHLINGHAHFLGSLYANDKIEMIFKGALSNITNKMEISYALDRRTLEMDADAFAATTSMTNLTEIINNKESHPYLIDHLENPYQIFELWSFAVHLIFMEFERNANSTYSKHEYYLPNSTRALLCHDSAINAVKLLREVGYFKCNEKEVELINDYLIKGLDRAQNYFNSIYSTKFNFYTDILNPNLINFVEEVQSHWNNKLRFKLQKFSRAPLYDPNGIKL